jgi:hypothetical protein
MTEQPVPNRGVTARGFTIYDDLEDDYGAQVRVQESSRAMLQGVHEYSWMWIFIKGGETENNDGAAHLNAEQAVRVRDAITMWLREIGYEKQEDGDGEPQAAD